MPHRKPRAKSVRSYWAAALAACALLPLLGCAQRNPTSAPVDLERRALNLLERAARDELDVLRANALEALVRTSPGGASVYALEALTAPEPLVRFAGCAAIVELREPAARGTVRKLLADPDPRVRLGAAAAAYQLGDRAQARVLLDTLNNDKDENLRSDAAYLLGRFGEPSAAQHLRLAVRRESSSKVRTHIYTALATLGDEDGRIELVRTLIENNPISRLIAMQSLAELRLDLAVEPLQYRLRQEGDYMQVRLLAARALGRQGRADGYDLALSSLDRTGDTPDETMRLRSLAALALGQIGDKRALPRLARLAETETDPRTQIAACYAILQISRPAAR